MLADSSASTSGQGWLLVQTLSAAGRSRKKAEPSSHSRLWLSWKFAMGPQNHPVRGAFVVCSLPRFRIDYFVERGRWSEWECMMVPSPQLSADVSSCTPSPVPELDRRFKSVPVMRSKLPPAL